MKTCICTHIKIIICHTIYVAINKVLLKIDDPQVIDSGKYRCRVTSNHSDDDELTLKVTLRK